VVAFAHAAHNLLVIEERDTIDGNLLMARIKAVAFEGLTGSVKFTESGDRDLEGGEIGRGAKDGRLERSDSSIPPTTIANNPPLVASLISVKFKVVNFKGGETSWTTVAKVRQSEERSDELATISIGTKAARACTSVQDKTLLLHNHRNNLHPSS